jgi:tetratricopeptide (TPR) repeat protein
VGPHSIGDNYPAKLAALRTTLHSNLAQCYLKLGRFDEAVLACDAALVLDSAHEKCLYRKAKALLALERIDESVACIDTLLLLQPLNKAAQALKLQASPAEEVQSSGIDSGSPPCAPESFAGAHQHKAVDDAVGSVREAGDEDGIQSLPVCNAATTIQPSVVPGSDLSAAPISHTQHSPRVRPSRTRHPLASAARKAFGTMYDDKPEPVIPVTRRSSFWALLESALNMCARAPYSWCCCCRAATALRRLFQPYL